MSNPTYVIGHRNPDTDSICSAIAYANLKRELGEDVCAARAGKVNSETKYALEHFGVEAPVLINDLYPRAKDIMQDIICVRPWDTMRDVSEIMMSQKLKALPVVDADGKIQGIISVGDLARRYYEEVELRDLSKTGVTYEGIIHAIDGKLICGRADGVLTGKVKIAAAQVSKVVTLIEPGDVIVVGDRLNVQEACIKHRVTCLIITTDVEVTPEICRLAEENGVIVITTPHDTYNCAQLIGQSTPVGEVMQTKLIEFKPNDLVSDIKEIIANSKHRKFPVVDDDGELVGVIDSEQLITSKKANIILVDHNESSQAVAGIDAARIIEMIDHHRLGGLETGEPIFIRHEPVGCTATIVANMYWQNGVEIAPKIAGLLLSAIISDTVLFKSPTCTDKDRDAAEKLAGIADLDIEEYGLALLKAGSNVGDMSAKEILNNDLKNFNFGQYKVAIGQISVMDLDDALSRKDKLMAAMNDKLDKEGLNLVLLMVTDIIKEGTQLLSVGEPRALMQKAFSNDAADFYLQGVMSRKKQIVPPLTEASQS